MRTINQKGEAILCEREGLYLKAYKCQAKKWTIGIGTTYYPDGSPVKEGDICTKEQAELWLDLELKEKSSTIEHWLENQKLILNDDQFSALLCFAYNCGCGPIVDKESSLCKAVLSGTGIREAFMLYNKYTEKIFGIKIKKVSNGLTTRRKMEADLYLLG